ncbi:MAG: type II toxin-antitoxin system HicB family antitoxin [Candidatus Diapherotrites archaeon]|nr:type II toxin-antitoxin system HicB family antitoxin [Candidatus Diapherotrites archaeon]
MDWKIVLEKNSDGSFTVTVPSLSGCISQGETKEEALKNIKEAIELHVSCLAEDGLPLNSKTKTEIVSVKL